MIFAQKVSVAGVQPVRLDNTGLCIFSCLKQIFRLHQAKKVLDVLLEHLKCKPPLKVWKIICFFGVNPHFPPCLKHVDSAAHVAEKRQRWYF